MTKPITSIKTTNAITRRIDLLQNFWDKFINSPKAQCCCWSVLQEELTMIDTFYQVNADESSDTPDIFLRLASPFDTIKNYGKVLTDELATLVDADREDLATEDIFIDWQPNYKADAKNHALGFLREFFHFADSLALEEGKVVIFLSPADIKNTAAWEKWWLDVLTLHLPDAIKLMVCDTQEHPFLREVMQQFPEKLMVLRPKLEMAKAMRELLNETGDQNDKGTHFKKAFFELTQCIDKQDASGIKKYARKAIDLARQMGYPHLEISVLCTTANGLVSEGKLNLAVKTYDAALQVAQKAKKKPLIKGMPNLNGKDMDDNLFEQLIIQILFSKGAAFVGGDSPQYQYGLQTYQEANTLIKQVLAAKGLPKGEAAFEQGGVLFLHRIEALRMTGFCLEGLKQRKEALDIYAKAITVSERLPREVRKNTTINFIGQAMLTICHKLNLKKEHQVILNKMNQILGKDWQQSLPVTA